MSSREAFSGLISKISSSVNGRRQPFHAVLSKKKKNDLLIMLADSSGLGFEDCGNDECFGALSEKQFKASMTLIHEKNVTYLMN